MTATDSTALFDHWAVWLLHQRHGDDAIYRTHLQERLLSYADRVLDGARLVPGAHLLDVGTGDGLVAFRALERLGGQLTVTLTDSSPSIIRLVEEIVAQRGVADRCRLLGAKAEHLALVEDATADAVTARSVFSYVQDKAAAFRAAFRVLKPGGRLSIAEPVMRDDALNAIALRTVLDQRTPENPDRLLPLLHRWKAAQYPDSLAVLEETPMTNFTERDLLRLAQNAGFTDLDLQLHIQVESPRPIAWQTFLAISPHPLAPTLGTILRDRFSEAERRLFEESLRPVIEEGQYPMTERMAYLSATRPALA
ncbi:class I SAM-dependent methyltransferase [Acidisoma sp. 7E03]